MSFYGLKGLESTIENNLGGNDNDNRILIAFYNVEKGRRKKDSIYQSCRAKLYMMHLYVLRCSPIKAKHSVTSFVITALT